MSLYNSNDFYITLRSDMCQKHRPFTSIFDCKIRAHKRDPFLIEGKNEIRYHMGAYGPLVVEHISEFHKKKLNKKVNKITIVVIHMNIIYLRRLLIILFCQELMNL